MLYRRILYAQPRSGQNKWLTVPLLALPSPKTICDEGQIWRFVRELVLHDLFYTPTETRILHDMNLLTSTTRFNPEHIEVIRSSPHAHPDKKRQKSAKKRAQDRRQARRMKENWE